MLVDLVDQYADSLFLDGVSSLMPAVGVGVVIGSVMVMIGLLIGFIVRASKGNL